MVRYYQPFGTKDLPYSSPSIFFPNLIYLQSHFSTLFSSTFICYTTISIFLYIFNRYSQKSFMDQRRLIKSRVYFGKTTSILNHQIGIKFTCPKSASLTCFSIEHLDFHFEMYDLGSGSLNHYSLARLSADFSNFKISMNVIIKAH